MHSRLARAALACAATAAALTAAAVPTASASPAHHAGRGAVVSVTPLDHFTQAQTDDYLTRGRLAQQSARNGVDSYRIEYDTVTPQGAPTTASGLLVLPRTEGRAPLPVVAFEHGTLADRADAPSVDGTTRPDRARTMMFAAQGYAAVAPDYLGLGTGPGHHPYTHAPSEATASVDLLRAARTATRERGRRLGRDVMITGFSQGGHAAMAFGEALQAGADPYFRLRALAPVSGPYDVEHAEIPAGLDGRVDPRNAAYYFGYWLTSMNRIHHLYDDPSEVFRAPYDTTVPQLFDGDHTDGQIAAGLPASPRELLTPQFLARAEHPTGELLRAIRESDTTCSGWTPRVPVRLYLASGDRNVAPANAYDCAAQLRSHGADVTLTDEGNVDHTTSVRMALPGILDWFETVRPAPRAG